MNKFLLAAVPVLRCLGLGAYGWNQNGSRSSLLARMCSHVVFMFPYFYFGAFVLLGSYGVSSHGPVLPLKQ